MNYYEEYLKDFIKVFDLNLPSLILKNIINEYEPRLQPAWTVGGYSPSIRKCYSYNMFNTDLYDDVLTNAIKLPVDAYCSQFNISISQDTGYNILKYDTGFYYKQHVDSTSPNDGNLFRILSSVLLLNDEFEGGQLSFFNGSYDVPLKKNQMVIFPSNFIFPHQVKTVTKGTRYSIVTWFM